MRAFLSRESRRKPTGDSQPSRRRLRCCCRSRRIATSNIRSWPASAERNRWSRWLRSRREASPSPSPWSDGSSESVRHLGADEAVADAAHRLDARIMPGRRQRETQPADVNVDGALFDEYVVAPDVVEQARARIDAPGVGDQELQQPEFGGPEIDLAPADRYAVRGRIEPDPGDLDHFVVELRRAPADHRLDARQQFAAGERLGDIVIRAALQP